MASPHSGFNAEKLVVLSTEAFDLVLKGKPCHPKYEKLKAGDTRANLAVESRMSFDAEVYQSINEHKDELQKGIYAAIYETKPCFFEEQSYELVIQRKSQVEVSFWHESALMRKQIQYVDHRKTIMTGILNFGSEIGYTELIILIDSVEAMKLTIEVFPSKLDYQKDYQHLLDDVNTEIHNLAYDFLKKTYQLSSINRYMGNSLAEYYQMLRVIFDSLMGSVDHVLHKPHHVLTEETEVLPYHKVRQAHRKTLRWIERNPQYVERVNGRVLPHKALSVKKKMSFDTYENRFVKFVLLSMLRKIDAIEWRYGKLSRQKDETLIALLSDMKRDVNRRIEFSFLKQVGNLHTAQSLSLVLNMAPGYKEVYKYYLMLLKGLSINGSIFHLSMKNVSELYEYWCFLKLNGLMAEKKYDLIKQDCIKVDHSGLTVNLVKGSSSKVKYKIPSTGENIEITYNPSSTKLPTVSQRPDSILSIEKHGSDIQYEYIFDAKYRINPAIEDTMYQRAYENPGPEEDDINTMHRYRDAIVVNNKKDTGEYLHRMFGAYVLFPYRDEILFQKHRFYQSINEVNIGGLPFLPGSTQLVSSLIDDLVITSSLNAFNKTILPNGVDEYLEKIDFSDRNVLVGMLKSSEQLQKCLDHRFYYIPKRQVAENRLGIKYVALYQSKSTFDKSAGIRFVGKIESVKEVERHVIKEVPSLSTDLYYRFTISEWFVMKNPIVIRGIGARSNFYTNRKLMDRARTVSELYCKSREEYINSFID